MSETSSDTEALCPVPPLGASPDTNIVQEGNSPQLTENGVTGVPSSCEDFPYSHPPSLKDFTLPDTLSDLTFVVQGQRLHVHRQYLAEWSVVWRKMFTCTAGRDELSDGEMDLPGKSFAQITELLHCIYPTQKVITGENVRFLLELSHEYQIEKIKLRCEQFLIQQERTLESLVLAKRFNLQNLFRRSIEFAKTKSINDLERNPSYRKLDDETKLAIFKAKVTMLTDYAHDVSHKNSSLTQEKNKISQERENMKSCLLMLENLWDTPNKQCYRHITNDKFDFKCADCNENMYRETRKLCGRGQFMRRYFPSAVNANGIKTTSELTKTPKPQANQ